MALTGAILHTLRAVLKNFLVQSGFTITDHGQSMICERNGVSMIIAITDDCSHGFLQDYIAFSKGKSAHRIVIHTDKVDDDILLMGEKDNIVFWGKEDVENEIGIALAFNFHDTGKSLKHTLSFFKQFTPKGETGPQAQLKVELTEPVPLVSDEKEMVARPVITREDVKRIGEVSVEGFKYDLELVPYFLLSYVYRRSDGRGLVSHATLSVNAMNGDIAVWNRPINAVPHISDPHVRLEPKIDSTQSKSMALEWVKKAYTMKMETRVEKDHATIVEKHLSEPDEGSISIEGRGMIYLPMWCVEGTYGVIILDASTGKIVSEERHQESELY